MKKNTGILIAVGAAVVGLFAMMGMGGEGVYGEEEEDEGDPEEEPPVDPGAAVPGTRQQRGKRVPAKTSSPFNEDMFSNKAEVMGRLAGLSFKYAPASTGDAAYKQALKEFQGDWNFLAAGDYLHPHKLNSSRLTVDGTAGYQTLKALEWAIGMSWPAKLNEAGLTS